MQFPQTLGYAASLQPRRPTRPRSPGGGGARARPQAMAHGAASTAQCGTGVSGPDEVGGGPASRPTHANVFAETTLDFNENTTQSFPLLLSL